MGRAFRRRGGNAIEFALIFPVFWLLLGGAADLGWLYYHQSILDTATNVGCRAGALVDPGWADSDITVLKTAAEQAMVQHLGSNPGTTCIQDEESCTLRVDTYGDPPGRSLLCSVERDFTPLLGVAARPVRLHSETVVRMEWQRWP